MGRIKELKPQTQAILPLTYEDSLSYYEVLGKLVDKVNLLIDRIDRIKPVSDVSYDKPNERIIIYEKEIF